MYSVSADYLTALAQPVHKYRLSGTVGTEAFTQSNIISGSLSISNKVSEGSEIKLGSVYTGELRATFTGLSIARGSWVGKKITLSEGLQLADESFEDVPLGAFTIAEATHKADGVAVVAYDAMTAFDKSRNDLTDTGTAYDFLSLMCQKCGVTLGMTSADVAALTNGTETLSIYSENDIETWRDLLSWIAQTLCSVATINRDGELELRQYSDSSNATIDETHRFTGCSFSDFTTYYTGMSVVNIALRQTEYKSVTPDDGLTYNLGSNPLVQGDYELVQNIIDDFSTVQLVPFSAQMLGGAIYDLCDCLTFSGGIAAGAVCGIMGFTWKYNGAYSVSGFGSNPALATAKSKAEKDIEAIYNTIGEEINQMSVVQNSSAVTCGEDTETSILTYNFEVTQEENTTMVDVSVVMTSSASETEVDDVYTLSDIVAHLSFYVDGSEVNVYAPEFIVDEGKDTMTFNYSLSGLSVGAHEFDIRLEMSGGSGSIAVGDVHEMLWGYGITFEVYVKSVEIKRLPNNTVYMLNSNFDYTGLMVGAAYNNGLVDDVTADCDITPGDGTQATQPGVYEVSVVYNDGSNDYEMSFDALVVNGCFFNENTFKAGMMQTGICVMDDEGNVSSVTSLQSITNDHEYINLITSGSDAKKFRFIRNGLVSQQYTLTKADGTLTSLGYCGIPGGFVYQYKVESKKYRLVKVVGDYELGVVSEEVLMEINRTDTDYGFIYGTFSQYGVYTGHIIYGFGNHTVTVPNGDSVRTCGFIDTRTGEYRDTDFPISTWPGMVCMDDGSLYALLPYKQDTYPDPTQILVGFYAWLADGTEIKIDMTSDFNLMCHGNTGGASAILRYDEENDCLVAYAISREATGQGYNFKAMKGFVLDLRGNIEREIPIPAYIDIPYASGLTDATKVRLALNGSTAQTGVVDGINYYPYWSGQRLLFTEANYFNSEGKNSPMKNIMVNIPCVPSQTKERIVVIDSLYWEDSPNSIVRATV